MDQTARENCGTISAKESLPEFGINDQQAGFLPSIILPEIYRTNASEIVNMIFDGFTAALKNGGRIELREFGSFTSML
jgi:nucleoid DNA-binding protein